jgi:uncharacterized protein (DUF2336 family)
MSYPSLLAELEVAVRSGTAEKRANTLRRITSLFLGQADQLNEQQISVFDDVLVHLVRRIETKALVQLSETLAPIGNAPIGTVRRLADNDDITVARPVLTQSVRLSDNDLADLARRKGQDHLLAISGRVSLPETVTDVLVERGDSTVRHALAKNSGARFSRFGFSTLVKNSQNDEALAESLGLRLDMPFEFLRGLLSRATNLVRSKLLSSSSPKNHERIAHALAGIANEAGKEAGGQRSFERADGIVLQLNQQGKLNEGALVKFIESRHFDEMTATLALFCGCTSRVIERILKNERHESLVMACKAAKLSWPTTSLILSHARSSQHPISEEELSVIRDSFLELSQETAQRTLRFMQIQEKLKDAG